MIVGVCNAFNMLDGMDGLVTSLVIIPSTFIAVLNIAFWKPGFVIPPNNYSINFLLFNLGLFGKKWKMFLGDSGSMGRISSRLVFSLFLTNEISFRFPPVTALWFVIC